mgnify:FL=1
MIKNNKGSTQLFLCLTLLVISGLISIFLIEALRNYQRSHLSLETLMCLRKAQYHQTNFISDVNYDNRIILANYPIQFSKVPYLSQAAKAIIIAMKLKQQYRLVKFYKDINSIKSCSMITKLSCASTTIYEMKAKIYFKRSMNQTVILKKKKNRCQIERSRNLKEITI